MRHGVVPKRRPERKARWLNVMQSERENFLTAEDEKEENEEAWKD
ncbi:MAG: hypothetical protein AAB267_09210 [Candidatus Desantisbacteria bacterium]